MAVRKYRPGRDPLPTKWHRGYVSKAQQRKFSTTPRLQKYAAGMRYWTPPVGYKPLKQKLAQLPRRKKRLKGR